MKQDSTPMLLKKFIDGITKAEAASAQMVHNHLDPRFFDLRFKLGAIKGASLGIAKRATGVNIKNVKPK